MDFTYFYETQSKSAFWYKKNLSPRENIDSLGWYLWNKNKNPT
jgi:hypothetical protein